MLHGYKKQFGQKGEDEACQFLKKNGYKIIDRNFRIKNGEIDIIAIDTEKKTQTLVFVEVKTRFSDEYGDPFEAITYYKIQAMQRTALFYTALHSNLPQLLRLDAVAVMLDHTGHLVSIKLSKNIG